MSTKRIERRVRVKPFVKIANYNHLLPTRYMVGGDIDLKQVVGDDRMANKETRKQMIKEVKRVFQDK